MTASDDLLDFVSAVSGDAYLKVEENLGDGFVRLRVVEAERRQAKHDIRSFEDVVVELLRNSRDAHAQRIFVATGREGTRRTLTIIDDGIGIPSGMHSQVFEPRVTSKLDTMVMDRWGVHGRGMALFSIRSNVDDARVAASSPHRGAAIVIASDVDELSERADQSTWPTIERDEKAEPRIARGPHNIIRRIAEFSLEHQGVDVYLGTPTEIASTMVALARSEHDASDLLFCDDLNRLAVWQRPAAAQDAGELVDVCGEEGLEISERTAHRILVGEHGALSPVLSVLLGAEKTRSESTAPDIYRDRRGLKIHHRDMAAFSAELEKAFDLIAERYFVHLKSEPRITIGREDVRVRFEVEKEE